VSTAITLDDLIASGIAFTELEFSAIFGDQEHGYIFVRVHSDALEKALGITLARCFLRLSDQERATAKARIDAALDTEDARLRDTFKVKRLTPR